MEKISFEQLRKTYNEIAAAAQEVAILRGLSIDTRYEADTNGGYEMEVALSKYLPEEFKWEAHRYVRYGSEPEEEQNQEQLEKLRGFIKEVLEEEKKKAEAQVKAAHEALTRIAGVQI